MTATSRMVQAMRLDNQHGVLLCSPEDVRWATGGSRSDGIVLVTGELTMLLTNDVRSVTPRSDVIVFETGGSLMRELAETCSRMGLQQLFYTEEHLPIGRYRRLKDHLDGAVALLPLGNRLKELRSVKDTR